MTDKEILEEIEYNVLNDPFTTFNQDSSYESVQIKATAIEELVKRFKNQQKEIERLKKESVGNTKYERLLFSIRMLHFHHYINDTQFEKMINKLSNENKGE